MERGGKTGRMIEDIVACVLNADSQQQIAVIAHSEHWANELMLEVANNLYDKGCEARVYFDKEIVVNDKHHTHITFLSADRAKGLPPLFSVCFKDNSVDEIGFDEDLYQWLDNNVAGRNREITDE